jgi:hypothetical protein
VVGFVSTWTLGEWLGVADGWRRNGSYWWSGGFAAARQARPDAAKRRVIAKPPTKEDPTEQALGVKAPDSQYCRAFGPALNRPGISCSQSAALAGVAQRITHREVRFIGALPPALRHVAGKSRVRHERP